MNMLVILGIYIIFNMIVAGVYVYDKQRAIKDEWRVPESTLIGLSILGPFGAAIAMNLAHHKTRKPKFKLVYIFLVINIAVIAYLAINPL